MKKAVALLVPYAQRQWTSLATASVATVAVTAAELAKPFPLKFVVDRMFVDREPPYRLEEADIRLLAGVAALVVGIALVDAVASYLIDVRLQRAGERMVHDLRVGLYGQLQRLSLSFHERRHTGDLVTRLTGDVSAIGDMFSTSLGVIAASVLLLVGMLVVSIGIDPVLALAAFAVTPILINVTGRFRRKVKSVARRQRAAEGELASMTSETLSAVRVVKAFGSERSERSRLQRKSEERLASGIEATRAEGRFAGTVDVIAAVGTTLVLVLGVVRVAAGALTPGDLIVMNSYVRRLYRPLRDVARQSARISKAMARAERVSEILAADEILTDPPHGYTGGRARGALELRDVTFAYDPARPVLDGLSLSIPAGQKVAVVGRSGAGKSTLASLIARFYDPTSGSVTIDGHDYRDCRLSWLRPQIGLVLQDTVLFSGTVAENIAYGTDEGRAAVTRAAIAAGADRFIRDLPNGYDTELGPKAVALSGGQRQRIAVARTLLRNPAVLVLDEPTTGLDAFSEAEVIRGLDALMTHRTTVMITHSLALARRADRVVVVERGRVVEEGRPEALLVADGPFRRLAAEQGLIDVAPATRPAGDPAVVDDAALPTAAMLLDRDVMAEVLQRSLGDEHTVDGVDIHRARYRPGQRLLVHYRVTIAGDTHDAVALVATTRLASRASRPSHVALAERAKDRTPAQHPLSYDTSAAALVTWTPVDLKLEALSEPTDRLRRRLHAVGVRPGCSDPQMLRYWARVRATLALDDHIIKLYGRPDEFDAGVQGLELGSAVRGIRTARLVGVLPGLLLTVQSRLPGSPPVGAEPVAERAGALLRRLHDSDVTRLPTRPAKAILATAATKGEVIKALRPDLGSRVEALLAELERSGPDDGPLVPIHGDFDHQQLLVDGDDIAVVDLDAAAIGPPGADLARFAARVVHREGDLDCAWEVLDLLVHGYGGRPGDLAWHLAAELLTSATSPFRHVVEDWPARIEARVSAAEDALYS